MSEVCDNCGLLFAPSPLPDKYDRDRFCWRRRAPGTSLVEERDAMQRRAEAAESDMEFWKNKTLILRLSTRNL